VSTYDLSSYDLMGRVGLPEPVAELAARSWDVVIVGGGHNGLTTAAYLARAGKAVLVLERRDQLGGACTLEQPFADERYVMSPCAYLVGMLHPLVIEELDLARYGYRTFVVDPTQWTPFEDGSALYQWHDEAKTAASVEELSPGDVDGFLAYEALFDRIRERLRRGPLGDTWIGDAPDRAALEALFADDREALEVVLEAPIAEVVERHVKDERLRTALHGQGVIGTLAGPREPGTAWIHAHHSLGLIGGWSFVEGGMGRVSFCLADAARDAGAVIAAGVPVAAIDPGVGVRLEGGETIRAQAVVSNADPVRTLGLLDQRIDGEVDVAFRAKVDGWRITSPVIKLNCALSRLPTFTASGGDPTVYRAQVEIGRSIDDTQAACDAARRGEPAPEWCELYFQTPYDPSVAPPGHHTMSVFAQFVPFELARGTWDQRRDEIADATLAAIARFAPDVADCVIDRQVLGPPDVEERIGLTGGHIFQGECLPDQMWDRRFAARTGVPGVYLCGAATHPGGSVMGVNGRNAADAVLADLGR
jgi:phytoene dehydrogenase-like protein